MTIYFKQLRLEQLDDLLKEYEQIRRITPPPQGWIRSVREALGMSAKQLAHRLNVSRSTVASLERSEARNKITLKSLDKLARGLGCRVVYAIVPAEAKSFSDLVRDRATVLAREQLAKVSHTMKLEAQGLPAQKEERLLERLINEYLSGSLRKLWQ